MVLNAEIDFPQKQNYGRYQHRFFNGICHDNLKNLCKFEGKSVLRLVMQPNHQSKTRLSNLTDCFGYSRELPKDIL